MDMNNDTNTATATLRNEGLSVHTGTIGPVTEFGWDAHVFESFGQTHINFNRATMLSNDAATLAATLGATQTRRTNPFNFTI